MAGPTQFKVFIGGPSDVGSDIESVKHCVDEINLLANPLGMRFEIFYWNDDAIPGVGTEPQALINEQADGYDAFIAIFGAKLGSPTLTHASGTVEEVERALSNIDSLSFGKNSVSIFFRGIKLDTRHSDLASAVKVQEFRSTLGPRGILFKDYDSDQKLREAVFRTFGVLMAAHIKDSRSEITTTIVVSSENKAVGSIPISVDDELGIMDFEVISQDNLQIANDHATRLSNSITALGDRVSELGDELAAANAAEDRGLVRRLIGQAATAMLVAAAEMDESSGVLFEAYRTAFEALESLIDIQSVDIGNNDEDKNSILGTVVSLNTTMEETITSISGFRDSIGGVPRLTKELNSAKRTLLRSAEELVEKLENARRENDEFVARLS